MPRHLIATAGTALLVAGVLLTMIVMGVRSASHIDSLRRDYVDGVTWNTSQLDIDLAKLRLELSRHAAGESGVAQVERRWNALQTRFGTLKVGATASLLQRQDFFIENFAPIERGLAEMSDAIIRHGGSIAAAGPDLDRIAASIERAARRLSVLGMQFGQTYAEQRRHDLVDTLAATALLAALMLVLLMGSVAVLMMQKRRLGRLARDLHAAKAAAESASRAKTHFLANMSHELRTPLNAIIGFSEAMAAETFGRIGNPRYKEYLHDVIGAGRHLLGLINAVLDVVKIESGKIVPKPDRLDLAEIAGPCLEMMRETARAKRVSITVALAPDARLVYADPQHLRQILINLLANAVKFAGPGGSVELGSRPRGRGFVEIWIRDDGIGIAAEHLEKVLEPFAQVHDSQISTGSGTGLGLPISRSLAELNRGRLRLDSTLGAGTTATVSLPAAVAQLSVA